MKNTGFYYVKEVAKEKSFSKASKKLGISQPALSSYINKLEKSGEYFYLTEVYHLLNLQNLANHI